MKSLADSAPRRALSASGAGLLAAVLLATSAAAAGGYDELNLVTDDRAALAALGFAPAAFTDPNLVNPSGIARDPAGPWWVANQVSTGAGQPRSPVVSLQQGATPPAGPIGDVFNGDGFVSNLDGSVSGWNGGTSAVVLFGSLTAAPEPGAWVLMIVGVGLLGAQIRALRRRQSAGD